MSLLLNRIKKSDVKVPVYDIPKIPSFIKTS